MRIVTTGRLASFLVLLITCCSCRVESQTSSQQIAPPPAVVIRFVQKVGSEVSAEKFYNQAPESLWEVYPEGDALKSSLIDFIKRGEDGPGLGFAGLALIPFHDPATVRPILERAMSQRTSQATRWCFLNAAPYILGMGDVMYGGEGKLDKESKELSAELLKFADLAVKTGTGHMHALQLEQLLNAPASTKKEDDYGLAVWHESAYLLGTVDLKDEQLVSKALTSEYRTVFQNAIIALSFAANRDFLMELKKKRMDEVTPTMEQAVGRSAITWWQSYLGTHPDGDWNDSVMSGFHDAGYVIEQDKKSAQSQRELLRALNDQNPIVRYNAYRVLNQTYGTHFDLDVAFFAGKYALSFLDPSGREAANEKRLKQYWQGRLNPQPANSLQTPPSENSNAAAPSNPPAAGQQSQTPISLGEAARRLREAKKPQN